MVAAIRLPTRRTLRRRRFPTCRPSPPRQTSALIRAASLLDSSTIGADTAALAARLLGQTRPHAFLVDLTGVALIASAGGGSIVRAWESAPAMSNASPARKHWRLTPLSLQLAANAPRRTRVPWGSASLTNSAALSLAVSLSAANKHPPERRHKPVRWPTPSARCHHPEQCETPVL